MGRWGAFLLLALQLEACGPLARRVQWGSAQAPRDAGFDSDPPDASAEGDLDGGADGGSDAGRQRATTDAGPDASQSWATGTCAPIKGVGLWEDGGSMADAERFGGTLTPLMNGDLLAVGGWPGMFVNDCGDPSPDLALNTERYSVATGEWSVAAPMTVGRQYHTATRLLDGRILVAGSIGACCGWQTATCGPTLASAELYAPDADMWIDVASMNIPRFWHTASLLPDGRVLVAGGECTNTAEIYDPPANTWTETTPMNSARCEGLRSDGSDAIGSVLLPDGRVLIAGMRWDSLSPTMSTEYYDPATATWSNGALPPHESGYLLMIPLPDGKVMVDMAYGCSQSAPCALADVLDPVTDTWTSTQPFLPERREPAGTLLSNGLVLLAGGTDGDWSFPAANLFDESVGTWTQASSMEFSRKEMLVAPLPQASAMAVGGWDDCQYSSGALLDFPTDRFVPGTIP